MCVRGTAWVGTSRHMYVGYLTTCRYLLSKRILKAHTVISWIPKYIHIVTQYFVHLSVI